MKALPSLDDSQVEAIFEAGGKLQDLRGATREKNAHETLCGAISRMELSRGKLRREDPDEALDLWRALVAGRWSLVDHLDTDQRRYILAVRNDPRFKDPRGLSNRERQVAEFAGFGLSAKQIAYNLGAPTSSVENTIRRIQYKLGLQSRAELTAFFSPNSLRKSLFRSCLGDEILLAGSFEFLRDLHRVNLTEAELEVLKLIVAGSTNAHIAKCRGSSINTVANQVQSIFRKYAVRSRSELVARMHGS